MINPYGPLGKRILRERLRKQRELLLLSAACWWCGCVHGQYMNAN